MLNEKKPTADGIEIMHRLCTRISEEKMKAFLEALDQPPQPKPRMKRLLSEPSVLGKSQRVNANRQRMP